MRFLQNTPECGVMANLYFQVYGVPQVTEDPRHVNGRTRKKRGEKDAGFHF